MNDTMTLSRTAGVEYSQRKTQEGTIMVKAIILCMVYAVLGFTAGAVGFATVSRSSFRSQPEVSQRCVVEAGSARVTGARR